MRLAVHIRAEHKVLFPPLAGMPGLQARLAGLREDHDHFMTALAGAVNALAARPPDPVPAREALPELRARLEAHNALEEAEVYPLVAQLPAGAALLLAVRRELAALPVRYRA